MQRLMMPPRPPNASPSWLECTITLYPPLIKLQGYPLHKWACCVQHTHLKADIHFFLHLRLLGWRMQSSVFLFFCFFRKRTCNPAHPDEARASPAISTLFFRLGCDSLSHEQCQENCQRLSPHHHFVVMPSPPAPPAAKSHRHLYYFHMWQSPPTI